jgi:CheY-like chemotaxis protein
MPGPAKTVAILVGNSALSSILTLVLAAAPSLRVRSFESLVALSTYMRLAPVDLVVLDFDCEHAPAAEAAQALQSDPRIERGFQVVALAGRVGPEIKQASIRAGIEEIIVKPMSPKYLLERVLSRLQRVPPKAAATPRPMPTNVVPLFPNGDHQPVY